MTKSLENKINDAVQSVEPAPEFTEKLWKEMRAASQPTRTPRRAPQLRWLPAAAILALVILVLAISPQQVWASLRGLFDFLPGIGLVQDDESTLYLTEPVSLEQDGATLTIEQVVSDANQTVISYRIEGLPNNGQHCSYNVNRLLLPDGKELLPTGGGLSNEEGVVQARIQFFTLPEGITQAALYTAVDPDDPEISACGAAKEWRVDFSLSTSKPADMELLPVVESTASSEVKGATDFADSEESDVQLFVDQVVPLGDGYILYGHAEYSDPDWTNIGLDFESLSATDADGKDIPVEATDDSMRENEFILKVAGKDFKAPLTVHVEGLWVSANLESSPAFSFDTGQQPKVGQTWVINQELELEGQSMTVLSARVIQADEETALGQREQGYQIEIRPDDSAQHLDGFIVCTAQEENQSISGQTLPTDEGSLLFETFYSDELPQGQVSCNFWYFSFRLQGDWQIKWQPPLAGD